MLATYFMIGTTGVLILSKGKIADRIPIFFKVFYIVSHTPILPFERIKTSVEFSQMSFQKNYSTLLCKNLI